MREYERLQLLEAFAERCAAVAFKGFIVLVVPGNVGFVPVRLELVPCSVELVPVVMVLLTVWEGSDSDAVLLVPETEELTDTLVFVLDGTLISPEVEFSPVEVLLDLVVSVVELVSFKVSLSAPIANI